MWLVVLSDQLPVVALVSRYLTNKLIGRGPIPDRSSFFAEPCGSAKVSGISSGFPGLSQSLGQVAHVLRTRSPLIAGPKSWSPFDLHVLSTPPAFVLSQDQTLRRDCNNSPHPKARGLLFIWKAGRPCGQALPWPTLSIPPEYPDGFSTTTLRWFRHGEPRHPHLTERHWLLSRCSVLKVRKAQESNLGGVFGPRAGDSRAPVW